MDPILSDASLDPAQASHELSMRDFEVSKALMLAPDDHGTPLRQGTAELPPEVDERVWGRTARALVAAFSEGSSIYMDRLECGGLMKKEDADRSPLMRRAALKAILALEDDLLRVPGDQGRWSVWSVLNAWTGDQRSCLPLLGRIQTVPEDPWYLPCDLMAAFHRKAIAKHLWNEILARKRPDLARTWMKLGQTQLPADKPEFQTLGKTGK
jgi:hypothetical protein